MRTRRLRSSLQVAAIMSTVTDLTDSSIFFFFLEVVYVIDSSLVDHVFGVDLEEKFKRCKNWSHDGPAVGPPRPIQASQDKP